MVAPLCKEVFFRWKECSPGTWIGVLAGKVWKLQQTENEVFYTTYNASTSDKKSSLIKDNNVKGRKMHRSETPCKHLVNDEEKASSIEPGNTEITEYDILNDYFQLSIKLQDLYTHWSAQDSNFKEKSERFEGIRMLRQHPVENLFSFICSSNNHISRISSMVEKLCEHYGEFVTEVDGQPYFSFPSISALAENGVEEKLRKLGFGYRAKYISLSAKYLIKNGGEELLFKLREAPYEEAKVELMKLTGVGAKVHVHVQIHRGDPVYTPLKLGKNTLFLCMKSFFHKFYPQNYLALLCKTFNYISFPT